MSQMDQSGTGSSPDESRRNDAHLEGAMKRGLDFLRAALKDGKTLILQEGSAPAGSPVPYRFHALTDDALSQKFLLVSDPGTTGLSETLVVGAIIDTVQREGGKVARAGSFITVKP